MSEKMMVKVSVLRKHPFYIRRDIKPGYVSELLDAMKDRKMSWLSGPAELQPIPTDHPERAEGGEYWILDGNNRAAACVELGVKDIPAYIHSGLTEADAIAIQLKSAIDRGLKLTPAEQTTAIVRMRDLKETQESIAKKTGLHQASISRILRGVQRADGGKSTTDAGGSKAAKGGKASKPFDAENWFKGLARLLKAWESKGTKIRKYGEKMEIPAECYKALDTLSNNLTKSTKEEK